jgi:hypothetical protein
MDQERKLAMKSPSANKNAAFRVAEKQKRDAFNQLLSKLSADQIAKLKHESLVAANKQFSGASPDEVVRQARLHFESRVRFLVGGDQ